jgi:AraC-like DNA-binding protein
LATICMHHVIAAMQALGSDGMARREMLINSGINPQLVQNNQRRVHTDQVARLFKNVQLSLGDEFMGFARSPCRLGAFKTMCDLVKHSRTLGELLDRAVDFYRLLNDDIELLVQVLAGRAFFSVIHHSPGCDPDHFLREFLLVIWHRFPSWYIGEAIRLRETHFSFDKPGHHDELMVMFPGQLKYGQAADCLVFDAHYLDRPLIRSHSEVDYYARNAPADVMTIPGSDNRLERQIERVVESSSPGRLWFPKIEDLAQRLGMGPQTLYRQLKVEGTSYQKIKDDIRRERAIRHLVDDDMSVEKVSEITGFSEARSFTRAFRYWTGMSPMKYKKSFRAEN